MSDVAYVSKVRIERVNVYGVIPTALNPLRMFLFQKPWEVPACPPR